VSGKSKHKVDGALLPDEVDIAAAAFQAALAAIDASIHIDPYAVRRCLAEYISEHALLGERDPRILRDGALRHLELRYMRQLFRASEVSAVL
jgi:hypothetical protein